MFRISSTSKLINLILSSIISATALILSAQAQERKNTNARPNAVPTSVSILDGTKEQDGLIGPVREVRTERAELSRKSGKLIEGPRSLLSTTAYNFQGVSTDNIYYLVTERNRTVGKEEYKYDDKGNVTELTLRNNHGGILSREVYSYEFDVVGNWKKMVTSLVIYEGGKLSYEPVEVTYRKISYFDETVARSDDNGINRSTVPRGTTVGVTGKPEDPLMTKPQAQLFSDGAANNQVIMIPNATFPDEAKSAGVTGTVAVMVEIDIDGKVVSARALRGHVMLQASAVEAALKARFSPSGTNRTSKRSGVISFTFSLVQ